MNETYYLKLTGKVNIPKPLSIGHNFKVVVDGSITDERRTDTENGEYDVIYTFRPIIAEISKDHGEVVKSKDVRSWSTKLRHMQYRAWEADGDGRPHEEAYNALMKHIIMNFEELYEESKK